MGVRRAGHKLGTSRVGVRVAMRDLGEGQVKDWTQELGRWLSQESCHPSMRPRFNPPGHLKVCLSFWWRQGIPGPGWKTWAREEPSLKKTANRLKAPTALPKDLSSVPSTHFQRLTASHCEPPVTLAPEGLTPLLDYMRTLACTHTNSF